MSFFSETRNTELSTLDYLSTQIAASWSNITILKTFTQAYDKNVKPPIVAIRLEDSQPIAREIGSVAIDSTHNIAIDIFGTSAGFRIDLADFITNKLKDGWDYSTYAHESGDKTVLVATLAGKVKVMTWTQNSRLDFGENVDYKDRFRHVIVVSVRAFV